MADSARWRGGCWGNWSAHVQSEGAHKLSHHQFHLTTCVQMHLYSEEEAATLPRCVTSKENPRIPISLTIWIMRPLKDRNHRPTDFKPGFCWSAAQFFSASTFCFIQTFTGCENDNRAGPKLTMTPALSCAPLRRARYQYQLWICMQAIYRHILAMTLLTVSKKSAPS